MKTIAPSLFFRTVLSLSGKREAYEEIFSDPDKVTIAEIKQSQSGKMISDTSSFSSSTSYKDLSGNSSDSYLIHIASVI